MRVTVNETGEALAAQPVQVITQKALHDGNGEAAQAGAAQSAASQSNVHATAQADFLQIESIVLNLDAALRVHARAHFFSWTQGLLQSLIRHELLICTLCHGKPPAFRADGFSMHSPDPALFSDMFVRDNSIAPALLK